ncbi:PAS-domain containing protein [Bradyrhizobium sp. 164]|uniref:PAS domain-containing protein n=1 Tax=Bradyrhizobium sp. 164 TaxID=2782637 RepID=UPI001FFA8F5A|nr:PAS-domain containing protein [Bradyrhizobium sp. 164]
MMSTRENEHGAHREQAPEALVAPSQLALDHMEQGVCVYDAHNRIVLVNQRYLTLFDMSADIVRVGTSYREVLAHSATRGNFPQDEIDALYSARLAQIAGGKPFRTEQRLASGLVMALELKPLPGGGWMTICDDVSRLADSRRNCACRRSVASTRSRTCRTASSCTMPTAASSSATAGSLTFTTSTPKS